MTTIFKVIKNEEEYNAALEMVEELVRKDPEPGSDDSDKLNLLATLIEDYETKIYPVTLPDPIDAIEFRMEQENLKPKDLIPYIGSSGKVSEVLSRKKPLTLTMIRALEKGLGIPAKVLVQETDDFRNINSIAWGKFPFKEMAKRGYFGNKIIEGVHIKELMEQFFSPINSPTELLGMLRKTNYRSVRPMDKYSLTVWSTEVVKKAKKIVFPADYKAGLVDLKFMQELAKLSSEENGPVLARERLIKNGIALIIEPHFSQTYLDGAAIMVDKKHPVIGLTLRYDRLDNFWFNLMHELAHVALHYEQNFNFFYDDLDNPDVSSKEEDDADELAGEALIPSNSWEASPAKRVPSPIAAESLAQELGIHPVIVAGKMRKEGSKYNYLNKIISQAKIRIYFPEINWSK